MPLSEEEIQQIRGLRLADEAGFKVTDKGRGAQDALLQKVPKKVFPDFDSVVVFAQGQDSPFISSVEKPFSLILTEDEKPDFVFDKDPRSDIKSGKIKEGDIIEFSGLKLRVGGPIKVERFIDPRDLDGSLQLLPVNAEKENGIGNDILEFLLFSPSQAHASEVDAEKITVIPEKFKNDVRELIQQGFAEE